MFSRAGHTDMCTLRHPGSVQAYLDGAAGGKEAGRRCLIVTVHQEIEIELAVCQLVLYNLVLKHSTRPQTKLS